MDSANIPKVLVVPKTQHALTKTVGHSLQRQQKQVTLAVNMLERTCESCGCTLMQQQLTSVGVLRANIPETMAFAITRTNMGIRCNNHLINLIWLVVSTCFNPLEIYESHWGEEMCQTTNRATDGQKSE